MKGSFKHVVEVVVIFQEIAGVSSNEEVTRMQES